MRKAKSSKMGRVFILLTWTVMVFLCGCKDKKEQVINSIKENLPVGTPFTDVNSYLQKTNFEYSYNNETKCFTAILRDLNKKAFSSENISLVIKMDEHDKLKGIDVKMIYTGL